MKTKFEIKHKWNGSVLFSLEADSLKLCVEAAVKAGADLTRADLTGADLTGADLTAADLKGAHLRGADLTGADLTGADLTGAYLTGAYLTGAYLKGAYLKGAHLRGAYLKGADLTGADLKGAHLRGAYLTGADLTGADLKGADLKGAYLTGADLKGADLTGAYLTGADLKGADLTGAVLTPIRDDLWAVLCATPREVAGLRAALAEGRIDGSTYSGECACLSGTMANVAHLAGRDFNVCMRNPDRPIERFFMAIKPGDTPAKNPAAKLALEWVDEWLANMATAWPAIISQPKH